MRFEDRTDAGRRLAEEVRTVPLERPVVLALPRGGVPVAREVAAALDVAYDVLVVRKVGAPDQPELAVGAVAEDGGVVIDERSVQVLGIGRVELDELVARQRAEVERRVRRYRGDRPLPDVDGVDVVLVDDGLATGLTADAAVGQLERLGARSVVFAAPVCSRAAVPRLRRRCAVVCASEPRGFGAVGSHYDDFRQVSDEEVVRLLDEDRSTGPGRGR